MSQNIVGSHINTQSYKYGCWAVTVKKSHILPSRCSTSACQIAKSDESTNSMLLCQFCRYEKELDLPQLPEMTFADNVLRVEHENGFSLEFNTLNALSLVDSKNDRIKVAIAEAWKESRMDNSKIKDVIKPFDWTFSTDYKGTIFPIDKAIKISETDDRIDIEKLKKKEKILFYEDVILFEDELADNGKAQMSVKMRVMPDSFFILLRYFLRVDNLLVRIIDTRVYYETGKNYLLREHMCKESQTQDSEVPISLLDNPSELWNHLPMVKGCYEKLEFLS